MLKKVTLSQEAVQWLINEHNFLNALLRDDVINAEIFQARLSKYSKDQLDGYWSEVYDQFDKVRGKEEKAKLQVVQTGMVKDGR